MRSFANRIEKGVLLIGNLTSWSIALLLVAIVAQVGLRYLFNYTNIALQDSQWYLYAAALMVGLSYTMAQDGHVRVDFLYQKYSDKTRRVVDVAGIALFAVPLYLFLGWHGWEMTAKSYALGEGSPNPGGLGWIWIVKALMPLGCLLLFIDSLARIAIILTEKSHAQTDAPHYDS